jgi:cysteine synthase
LDWNVPCYNRLPDPIFEIAIDDFELPVIELPQQLLSLRLQNQRIHMWVVLGFLAPPGNIKRIPAGYMIEQAVAHGHVAPGGTLVEPTSGNMGVSLAYCARKHAIRVIAIVSDKLADGKLRPLTRHGAEVIRESEAARGFGLTGSPGSIALAEMYARRTGAVFLNQYGNPWNPQSYETLVAPQLWERLGDRLGVLVSAIGSTGTLIGLGSYFRTRRPGFQVVATMPYLGQEIEGTRDEERLRQITHDWRGIATAIDPIDELVARRVSALLNEAGIPAGPSSGAALRSADHFLLQRMAEGTLDALRNRDGSIGVLLPFADTLYPYA